MTDKTSVSAWLAVGSKIQLSSPPWTRYLLAAALSVATLLLLMQTGAASVGRPLLVILVLPVILSAMLGGGGPGLFATLLVALGIDYVAIPPVRSLAIREQHDLIDWSFLVLNGVLASILAGQMRRSWRQCADSMAARLRATSQLEAIVVTSSDAIIGKDLDGIITSWNAGAEQIFGYSAAEALGRPMTMLFVPGGREEENRLLERIRRGEQVPPFEAQRVRKDGTRIVVSVAISPIKDPSGRVTGASKIARDITAAKGDQEALRAERDLSDALIDTAPAIVLLLDTEGRIVRFNAFMEQLCGYRLAEVKGSSWFDTFLPRRDRERIRLFFSSVIAGTSTSGDVNAIVTCGGDERLIEWHNRTLTGQDGTVAGVLAIGQDVTERRRSEEALRRSEAKYRELFETMTQGCFVQQPDGVFTDVNPAALDLFGLSHEEFLNRTASSRQWRMIDEAGQPVDPEQRPSMRALYTGQPVRNRTLGIFNPRRSDYVWLTVNAIPRLSADGRRPASVFVTLHDITDQKRAEQSVRESEARLREAKRIAGLGHWEWDLRTDQHRWSEEIYGFYGRDPSLPAAVYPEVKQYFTPQSWANLADAVEKAIAEGKAYECDAEVVRPDGSHRWITARGEAVFAATGKPILLRGTVLDISARKMAEEALRQADRRKDEFLATLAHELRNPLAPLRTGLEILRLAKEDASAHEQALAMMNRQLEQLVHLVNDLLDVSRISHGSIALKRTRVVLADSLTQAMESVRPLIDARGQLLHVAVPSDAILIDADPVRLTQIFANLLDNAAKYTAPGGQIRLNVEREGGQAVVTIADTGIGIPSALLPRVFELFVHDQSNLEQSGLGIGLHLVRQLVSMHGGEVEAHSAGPDQGSTFVVRLPVADQDQPEPPENGSTTPLEPAVSQRRILIIDDNQDVADSLELALRLFGHEVRTAYDGHNGLRLAAEFHPDIILLDLGMPTLDGYATAARVRAEPWGHDVILIALTGWGQEEDRLRTKAAGFDHHLTKPVDVQALAQLLAGL